jgi:glycosyltransferase involved in cell wall biosynthesis
MTIKNKKIVSLCESIVQKYTKKYSICITNYNSIDTIKLSIESILHQIDNDFEIVVCDNISNDGSQDILREYAKNGKIKLIVKRCGRGKGRQIAFENSIGKYIISGIDTDDRLKSTFKIFLAKYHNDFEGYMLSSGTIHIIPRNIVLEIGGWRDLTWGEDVDFCKRAKSVGKQQEINFPIKLVDRGDNKRSLLFRLYERYEASKCYYRMGITISEQVEMAVMFQKPMILILATFAFVISKIKKVKKFQYTDSKNLV